MDHLITLLQLQYFTENEAIVYLHLLKLGETRWGPLFKATQLSKESLSRSILTLYDKGFVSFEKKKRFATRYRATAPRFFFDLHERQLLDLQNLVPKLESLQK